MGCRHRTPGAPPLRGDVGRGPVATLRGVECGARAAELAEIIAAKPAAVVQGTVRAIWQTHGLDRETAQGIGWHYTRIGNPLGKAEVSRETAVKPTWTLR